MLNSLLLRTGRTRGAGSTIGGGPPQSKTISAQRVEAAKHYQALFGELERKHGRLDDETLTSIIGFGAGGPVSLSALAKKKIYVTCELSLYPEQKESAEGLKFELLSLGAFDEDTCRTLFTALGNLSMNAILGDGHTVDVSGVMSSGGPVQVRLELFSEVDIGDGKFGVYEVVRAQQEPGT